MEKEKYTISPINICSLMRHLTEKNRHQYVQYRILTKEGVPTGEMRDPEECRGLMLKTSDEKFV